MKARVSPALPAMRAEHGEARAQGYFDWRTIVRHQTAALVATLVDFGVMISVVQGLGVSPVAGTVAGAAVGAGVNFTMGRRWIFPTEDPERMHLQAVRYAVVSLASLVLNALGEFALNDLLRVQYVAARLVVAVAVSVAWNYPLHRAWVFAARSREA